jgi:hypothetical protein
MHRLTGPMLAGVALCMSVFLASEVAARDDGRYANEPLHAWFDQLASGKGLCCSFADGFKVENVDWDTQNGQYRVRLHGEWVVVPENAVVTEPNKYGPAVVWPYMDVNGATQIRCFLPGAGA